MNVSTQAASELQGMRLAEIVRYAQKQLGGDASQRASQRALSEKLGIAPTMIGRYLTNNVCFNNIRAETVRALADAAGLNVGTLYTWMEHGRDAAMAYEQRLNAEPVAFEPIDLAKQLVRILEEAPPAAADAAAEPPAIDSNGLMALLEEARREGPRLFDRMVRAMAAEAMLQRLAIGELEPDDWLVLAQLLEQTPRRLQERYGPARFNQPPPTPQGRTPQGRTPEGLAAAQQQ